MLHNDSGEKRKVYVLSNGCHESFMDAAMLEQHFGDKEGFEIVETVQEADLIVLLGCSVMQHKEDQTIDLVETLNKQKRADAEILVTGCISKVRPDLIANDGGTSEAQTIANLLRFKDESEDVGVNFPYQPYRNDQQDLLSTSRTNMRKKKLESMAGTRGIRAFFNRRFSGMTVRMLNRYDDFVQSKIDVWGSKTYTIKISTGCLGVCTYCSIKFARGSISSRSIGAVVKDFRKGLKEGFSDFALIGTDLGDYGKDRDKNLLDLLKAIVDIEGDFNIRLRNVNPRWVIPHADEFCELLKTGKISYIQSPAQSCSNHVLELMGRGYTADGYFEAFTKIRAAWPKLFIKSQLIVGFPGETEEDYAKANMLYDSDLFNYVDVFSYSDRPNTKAVELPDHVPHNVLMKRYRRLLRRSLFRLAPKQILKQAFS